MLGGQFVWKERLTGPAFLFYWLVCFCLTLGAMVAAVLDLRDLGQVTRQEQKRLLEQTLNEIQADAGARKAKERHNGSPQHPRRN